MSLDLPAHSARRMPRSLYAETARGPAATPPLSGNKHVRVAIVGGGFTGLSTALHLASAGVEAAVIEANEPGWGASGRNGGQVNPGLKHEPNEIEHTFGAALGARMIALSGNAPTRVFDLIRDHQIRCDAGQTGTIRAAFTERSSAFLRRATRGWQERGAPVELLEGKALAEATGTERYLCAALDRRGGSVNPLGYARGLAEAAMRLGASIHGGTRAVRIAPQGSEWAVTTSGGTVTADWVVLATNGYTDGLWPGLRQTLVPLYSGIVATEPLPDALARRILPQRSVLYEHEDITVYFRLDAANRLLMGGRSRQWPVEGTGSFSGLRAYAERLYPFLAGTRWSHGWNGQLGMTTSHYPHFAEPARNVIACMGYNGRGIAMATVMGGEIARWIGGEPPDNLDMPVRPLRPIPFHRFWPVGVTARIAFGRIRTALRS